MNGQLEIAASYAVRPCGMEAVSELQHRTKVNLSAGLLAWVSAPLCTTPSIRSWPGSIRGGSGRTLLNLTPQDVLHRTLTERQQLRERESTVVLASMRKWLDSPVVDGVLPKSDFAEALRYIRNHWAALNVYVDDGRIPIDNNSVEQLMKTSAPNYAA